MSFAWEQSNLNREICTYEIKPIDVGLVDPALKLIGDLGSRADRRGTESAHGDQCGHGVFGPLFDRRRGMGECFHRGSD